MFARCSISRACDAPQVPQISLRLSRRRLCPLAAGAAGPRGAVPPPPLPPQHARLPPARAAAGEPFQPERTFHKGVVDAPEESTASFGGITFSDIYYYINIGYWSVLLLSVLTGNDLVSRLAHFELYTTAMFACSVAFLAYHTIRFARDLQQHLQSEARADWRQVLRFAWNAIFWLGFVLWYVVPPVPGLADVSGTPGAIVALFGAALAVTATLQVGMFSLMGSPSVPRRLNTRGVYALLRHPQALGNILFLAGFSIAGGALWACLTFLAAFAFYCSTVVPAEERMLKEAFGDAYSDYARRTPRFAYALALLAVLVVGVCWCFQPWAVPIEVVPPPATKV